MIAVRLGALAALSSSLSWSVASTVFARAARRHGPLQVGLARTLLAAPLFLLAVAVALPLSSLRAFDGARVGWTLLSSLCSFALADLCFFIAARRLGTSRALALASIFPLWTALAGALWFGERLLPWRGVGMLLCVAGVVSLILLRHDEPTPSSQSSSPAVSRAAMWSGVMLALLTSLMWALNGIALRKAGEGASILLVNALRNVLALAILAVATVAVRRKVRSRVHHREPVVPPTARLPKDALRLLWPAILLDGLYGAMAFVYAFAHAPLAVAATLSSLAPLFSVPVALYAGDERFSLPRSLAIAATVGGIVLIVVNGAPAVAIASGG